MKLLMKNIVCLSIILSVVSACSSSNNTPKSRFYAPNRTPTVSDEFRSDADLEQAINQSFKKSQKPRNNLEENQKWDAGQTVKSVQYKKTERKKQNVAVVSQQPKKNSWTENPQQSQNNDRKPVVYSASTKTAYLPNQYTETQSAPTQQQTQYVIQAKQTTTTTQTNTTTPVAGQYYIQAGCYSREEVALSQVAKLKANGIGNVSILNEGGLSKVRVGPYASKESGAAVLNKMKNQLGFVDSFWKY